uniref:CS012 protein n=1 Tax=Labrus bergylta TaxID=56723 RepID=A0A3Q3F2L2_9LABR
MASRVDDVMRLCCELLGHKKFQVTAKNSFKGAGTIGGAALVGGLVAGPVGVAVGGLVGGVLGSWFTWGKFKPLPQILKELTPAQKQKLYNDILAVIGNLRWTDAAHLIALVMANETLKQKVTTAIINYVSKELSA